jgi:hypothetical protein
MTQKIRGSHLNFTVYLIYTYLTSINLTALMSLFQYWQSQSSELPENPIKMHYYLQRQEIKKLTFSSIGFWGVSSNLLHAFCYQFPSFTDLNRARLDHTNIKRLCFLRLRWNKRVTDGKVKDGEKPLK